MINTDSIDNNNFKMKYNNKLIMQKTTITFSNNGNCSDVRVKCKTKGNNLVIDRITHSTQTR